MLKRPEFPLFLLALVALVGIIVLSALQLDVPAILQDVLYALLLGGAAVTHPSTLASALNGRQDPVGAPVDIFPVAIPPADATVALTALTSPTEDPAAGA